MIAFSEVEQKQQICFEKPGCKTAISKFALACEDVLVSESNIKFMEDTCFGVVDESGIINEYVVCYS